MKKKTILLFLCYLLLTAFAVLALMKRSHTTFAGAGLRSEIPRFRPEEIAGIKIEWRTNSVTLEKKDGNWKLVERGMKNASAAKIARLLESLSAPACDRRSANHPGNYSHSARCGRRGEIQDHSRKRPFRETGAGHAARGKRGNAADFFRAPRARQRGQCEAGDVCRFAV